MNIATILSNAAGPFAARPALFHGEQAVCSYAELHRRAGAIGGWLRRQGIGPGQFVGLYMKNVPAYFEVLFGVWYAGACAVPINAKLHAKEVAFILENCRAPLAFATDDLIENLPGNLRVIDPDTTDYARIIAGEPAPMADVKPTDMAWLFYTSGTTGRPKGAMLSHRNLFNMTVSFLADIDPVDCFDASLYPAPISHGAGLLSLAHFVRGAAHIVPESGGFEPPELITLINRFPGSSLFAAPTMLKRLVDSPAVGELKAQHIDQIFYGGGPMYVEDLKRALDRLGPCLWQLYGQGEAPCTISYLPKHLHLDTGDGRLEQRLASAGIARSGVQMRVVDAEDRELPPGETGEVIARGDVVMEGYWANPEASATTLRNGWLHTGDVGFMDGHGFLTLKDRVKDMIISGGSNIYPREVEEVLLLHPAVLEVSVIGKPHEDWGEEVVAIVVPRPGQNIGAAELDQLCLDNIARFKRPKAYHIVDALPKNNYGKILKTELRKLYG
ncbi:AMP-binding protein [Ferrovibrio sp. MS7]|uniref:AMP-binding protein n=1 Tax=Ferrovibrio plantarum TaxID=3119164 RepID=UPI00313541BB